MQVVSELDAAQLNVFFDELDVNVLVAPPEGHKSHTRTQPGQPNLFPVFDALRDGPREDRFVVQGLHTEKGQEAVDVVGTIHEGRSGESQLAIGPDFLDGLEKLGLGISDRMLSIAKPENR